MGDVFSCCSDHRGYDYLEPGNASNLILRGVQDFEIDGAQQMSSLSFKDKIKFKTVEQFEDHYEIQSDLGEGSFGCVKVGKHRNTDMLCAVKIIDKEQVKLHEMYQQLNKNELEILEVTQHPNITRIFELMEDDKNFYIVMELVSGGNLFTKIRTLRRFTEQQAAQIIKQVLLALNFMHSKNIMHRDIKPENILCESSEATNDQIDVKLTDFGFATKYTPGVDETLVVGSPLYMAPELCQNAAYDSKVDIWAVGVITYILLSGKTPFQARGKNPTP